MGVWRQLSKHPPPFRGETGTRPTQGLARPPTPRLPGVQAQSVPGLVPFFRGTLVVAAHIWSLDSEALRAGPTAWAGHRCPLFAQLKLVNWN